MRRLTGSLKGVRSLTILPHVRALCRHLPGAVGTRGYDFGFGLSWSVSVRFPLISIETLMASHLLSASCLSSVRAGRVLSCYNKETFVPSNKYCCD